MKLLAVQLATLLACSAALDAYGNEPDQDQRLVKLEFSEFRDPAHCAASWSIHLEPRNKVGYVSKTIDRPCMKADNRRLPESKVVNRKYAAGIVEEFVKLTIQNFEQCHSFESTEELMEIHPTFYRYEAVIGDRTYTAKWSASSGRPTNLACKAIADEVWKYFRQKP